MRLDELYFDLPEELIAQQPAEPRDSSRLLVLDRARGTISHRVFRDILEYLRPGDCLTLNDTRVIRARFYCRKPTGGRVEALFLHHDEAGWHVLLKPAARLRVGGTLHCEQADTRLVLLERLERGEWRVRAEPETEPFGLLERIGQTPLPPYIRRDSGPDPHDDQRYQTVYAEKPGAVAAPTAGLHFTPELLAAARERGVRTARVTLHVGLGTFTPVSAENLADHHMHAEYFEAPAESLARLHETRRGGGRIVAVGTTTVRVLESLPARLGDGAVPQAIRTWSELFIYPPYAYRNVDLLVTNFHLPYSSLIALVMAFAGVDATRRAYAAAVAERYRFFSFGDAMLIV